MDDSLRPRRQAGFLTQELDGELILYHPDQSQALCLNPTASLVWGLCDGATTVAEIASLLQEAFPGATGLVSDVHETLELFSRHSLVRV